ncbi:MAG: hypothetical protein ACYDA2_07020 [Acidimicrobiales bacterium]
MAATQTLAEASRQPDDTDWNGPKIRYDLVKEFVVALVVVGLLAIGLALVFSSPDDHPVTIRQWSQASPADFLATAVTELDGSSASAGYGPPYNAGPSQQKIGPLNPESWIGVHVPVDPPNDFVLKPLAIAAASDPSLASALATYDAAPSTQQQHWTTAYEKALGNVNVSGSAVELPGGGYGPVAPMMNSLLGMARTGSLDSVLLASPQFYGTDYTKPLLFLADGSYMADKAQTQHLQGSQWGMMNETGNFPGQAWLWLYTMWYQVWPFTHTGNADALVWSLMMLLTLGLLLVPLIPGLRDIPRLVPVYRVIWRDHYRRLDEETGGTRPRR